MTKIPYEKIPTEIRDLTAKSVEEARKAFESFIEAAHKAAAQAEGTANALRSSAKEAQREMELGSCAASIGTQQLVSICGRGILAIAPEIRSSFPSGPLLPRNLAACALALARTKIGN